MNALILNDIHLGAQRTAGTTQESRKGIKSYLQQMLREALDAHYGPCIINGDLFDGFDVEVSEVLQAFYTFSDWLASNTKRELHLVQGNHDIAKNSEKLGSFAFLCKLLTKVCPSRVYVYDKGLDAIAAGVFVIPHVVNQDRFDLELQKALDITTPAIILFHANVDNHYAEEADHSLNVSEEWIEKLTAKGHTLVFAHEHQHKTLYKGKVIVCGNQWPSSVADCLTHGTAQSDGKKYCHFLEWDFISEEMKVTRKLTWDAIGDYTTIDWRELSHDGLHRFIRVTGNATADEAQEVITRIAKYRSTSRAFVITNAVQIEGIEGLDDLSTLTQENLAAIDILAALKEELDEREGKAVDDLLEKADAPR